MPKVVLSSFVGDNNSINGKGNIDDSYAQEARKRLHKAVAPEPALRLHKEERPA
jgi:hypothetical protein